VPDHVAPLDLGDFLFCLASASKLGIDYILESDDTLEASNAALVPHRVAIEQGASLANVLVVLGLSILKRNPSPKDNVTAAVLAIDELVFMNACQWSDRDIEAELKARLEEAARGVLLLTEFAIWLDDRIDCSSND
jgi:hypothetical protein